VSPVKSPLQPLYRAYFFLAFSVIYLYVMSGNSLFKIGAILGINYAIAKIGGSARWMPTLTWIFNIAILFANEKYEGYMFSQFHPSLSWLVSPNTHFEFDGDQDAKGENKTWTDPGLF
jgi:hypothetical protein